ncbi:glucosamine/fructose-6-phosphate aminotransferase, isomerizing [Desulfurispirillum indicum S5]|uniref:Glutamine--fructose-6-phosphate aminotransferase [isomerizing] n=1 Tax=Desulfurispirillum indicum (strain ATCC BAA-1389 / DSM 22839 / S5) TaxID=653733 RepID=E6W259_DESIS|nr:glutamine--fructose-6-phosphate transaminase (isomerizing) [Desulfurispirillum indicum]ADU65517.1 glucosamine/fructose-6-phosphate aminotransferase, isomerizing [Desulfurispirillum indicum S5]
MCGIVGYTGSRAAMPIILEGLKRLEYRGYDSAGIATMQDGNCSTIKEKGKLMNLEKLLASSHLPGSMGIGHTRWATHGKPSVSNAHPHQSDNIYLVHNGIIENHKKLKASLEKEGYTFLSQTDTEVIAHLIRKHYQGDFLEAVMAAVKQLKGAFSIVAMDTMTPQSIVCVKKESPLVIGTGADEHFIASDIPAVLSHTRDFQFLEDGDIALVTPGSVQIYHNGVLVERPVKTVSWSPSAAEKGGYKHFMLKEIYEQPRAIRDTLMGKHDDGEILLSDIHLSDGDLAAVERIQLVACGTSWHAAMIGKYYIEKYAAIPVEVDIASEYRYRPKIINPTTLVVPVSQSGETADTLAALKDAKQLGAKVICICNVVDSSIARESHGVLYTNAGPEIGVASTKAFTTQLAALYLLALFLGQKCGHLKAKDIKRKFKAIEALPEQMEQVLSDEPRYTEFARNFHNHQDFLFLGRSYNFPIALEGALKLKEISYIHAEGYAAGEMKHGPIALIDKEMPVVVVATASEVYEKTISNIEEVMARNGLVIAITNPDNQLSGAVENFVVPEVDEELSPLVNAIPMQFLAYHIADYKGCDVDQPRNLAKSVTVE